VPPDDAHSSSVVESITALISGSSISTSDEFFDDYAGLDHATITPDLVLEPGDFIRRFSTINLTLVRGGGVAVSLAKAPHGGSRDEPTPHRVQCRNASIGCHFTSDSACSADKHMERCTPTTVAEEARIAEKKQTAGFHCLVEDCSKSYLSQAGLDNHVRDIHEYVPAPCDHKGCEHDIIYDTFAERVLHNGRYQTQQKAAAWVPKGCPKQSCPSNEKNFATEVGFQTHMKGKHQLDRNAVKRLIPRLNVPSLYELSSTCPFVGVDDEGEDRPCRHPIVFETWSVFKKHLYEKHGLNEEERLPWLWMCVVVDDEE